MSVPARILITVALVLVSALAGPWSSLRAFSQQRRGSPTGLAPKPRIAPEVRSVSIREVWRAHSPYLTLDEIGSGKGIVFSPDLSAPGNREFYRALGFAYFEDPDWHVVVEEIKKYNTTHLRNRIESLLVMSHGTNGDALKLQAGSQPDAPRSYIAPAALQENLEGTGIRYCLLAACNAGRLFRSANYRTVQADAGNPLFEPPTLGIINASKDFNPDKSSITIARRAESHLEVINECGLSELSPAAVAELTEDSKGDLTAESHIAVPEMLIQLLLKDEELRLVLASAEIQKSRAETVDKLREDLINRFFDLVNDLARDG
jgi:hypothetical protein